MAERGEVRCARCNELGWQTEGEYNMQDPPGWADIMVCAMIGGGVGGWFSLWEETLCPDCMTKKERIAVNEIVALEAQRR